MEFIGEFPGDSLSVSGEPVQEISAFELATGILPVISVTDYVNDRRERARKAPLERLELSLPAPEADALSTELQGRIKKFYHA